MLEIEQFFTDYEHTAWAFFSVVGFLFILYRMALGGLKALVLYIESNLRMKYQAEFFDRNHGEIKELRDDMTKIKEIYAAANGRAVSEVKDAIRDCA